MLSTSTMMSILVFLATGVLAFAVMVGMRAREAVRRRAARVGVEDDAQGGRRDLRSSGVRAAQKLIDYANKHYSSVESKDVKVLRQRMMRAGIYDPRGPAIFFLARIVAAIVLAGVAFLAMPMLGFGGKASSWIMVATRSEE